MTAFFSIEEKTETFFLLYCDFFDDATEKRQKTGAVYVDSKQSTLSSSPFELIEGQNNGRIITAEKKRKKTQNVRRRGKKGAFRGV